MVLNAVKSTFHLTYYISYKDCKIIFSLSIKVFSYTSKNAQNQILYRFCTLRIINSLYRITSNLIKKVILPFHDDRKYDTDLDISIT